MNRYKNVWGGILSLLESPGISLALATASEPYDMVVTGGGKFNLHSVHFMSDGVQVPVVMWLQLELLNWV